MKLILERIFDLQENNTNIKQEFLAGFTTFITMAYIIFVNPQMMSASGMDHGASFVGTCIAAALACFVMGFYSNWPVALAPGMGLNAFFTYTVVGEMGYSWEVALGAVFLAGILFVIMSVTPLRRWMLDSIPLNLRIAMGSGVGLFIGFIGLKSGGIIVANEATFVSLGNFLQIETFLSAFGFLLISVLATRKISGAIIIGVLIVTLLGLLLNIVEYQGLVSYPPSVAPIFLKLDILGALDLAMISVIISFLFVNLFDTAGTLLGVAHRAKLVDQNGNIKNFDKALKADSTSSVAGSFFGCAPVTSYVESSAGVEAGGRTGLTAVVVGFLFLVAIFFSPLAAIVPAYATAGALLYVAILMLSGMEKLDWSDTTELLPALIMVIMIPLTFSIANGIALGFISYVVMKLFVGDVKKISSGAWFLAIIFMAKFVFLP
ncbi:NCS2 family permease [Gammaproteobacteria bacterium]|nr:NCS2 family permease [Gammaproteobacteria bacterium]MDA7856163.1 NCS2 family permease [Gammaproteobacteria bacterium]MDA8696266.1 NCS2 family permease [Gammaproteobacteria bacterium]MDA8856516.1 NCS2 family permease [Gammaproteobacteria bacterium]MDA8957386.1 NCS2 family permease [Gammaproteobacteria bacterium]